MVWSWPIRNHKLIWIRLIVEALGKLKAGETIVFELKRHTREKDSRLVLSRAGVKIDQAGIFGRKALSIKWNELRMKIINGQCNLSSYTLTERKQIFSYGTQFETCNGSFRLI